MSEPTFRVFVKDLPPLLITCQPQQLGRGAVTTDIRARWEGAPEVFSSISRATKARGKKAINPNNEVYLDAARTIKLADVTGHLDNLEYVDARGAPDDPKLMAARQNLRQKIREHDDAEEAVKVAVRAASIKLEEKTEAEAAVRALEEAAKKRTHERARLQELLKRKADAELAAASEEREAAARQARAAAKKAKCAEEKERAERQLAELDALV